MKFNELLEELRELKLPPEEFTIFGSGPLAIRNIRDCEDIDIVVTKKLFKKLLKQVPENKKKKGADLAKLGNIEFGYRLRSSSKNNLDLIHDSDNIDGLRFVSLPDLIECKKKFGREKDIRDISLIEEYLKKNEKK